MEEIVCVLDAFWRLSYETILSGLFTVIGGAIPISIILFIIFRKTKSSFLNSMAFENKLIEKYDEQLKDKEARLNKLNELIANGDIRFDNGIPQLQLELQKSIDDTKQEILLRTIWVTRVESSTFLKWVGFYFTKSYFSDYFRK